PAPAAQEDPAGPARELGAVELHQALALENEVELLVLAVTVSADRGAGRQHGEVHEVPRPGQGAPAEKTAKQDAALAAVRHDALELELVQVRHARSTHEARFSTSSPCA